MGIIAEQRKKEQESRVFAVIAGTRLSGKSTIAGTLPGKTLMLQASPLETGSKSALKLASKLGNDLTVCSFSSVGELWEYFKDKDLYKFDNLYIDGLSAITEQLLGSPEVKKIIAMKNDWAGYRELWVEATNLLLAAKEISTKINVFFSMAMREERDSQGNVVEVKPEVKGNATLGSIQRLCPTVLYTIAETYETEDGEIKVDRKIIAGYRGVYAGRIDSFLDGEGIDIMNADLGKVLELL